VRRVEKRPRAEDDLREIWFYTLDRWGEEQAETYIRSLDTAMQQLCEAPALGADYGHVLQNLRKRSVERHRIFYYVTDTAI
jgi:toxin ParE1/3/4